MIGMLDYMFVGHPDTAAPMSTNINKITTSGLLNSIVDNFLITKDVDDFSGEIPTEWNVDMILNAGFNGNLNGGDLKDSLGDVTGYRIKKRKLGDFNWITIKEQYVTNLEELNTTFVDYLSKTKTEYEYAFVPILGEEEGQYSIKTVISNFNSLFLYDGETQFSLNAGLSYGDFERNQKIGIFEPFGKKYPTVISNGNTDYETGSFTGTILPDNYNPAMPIQRKEIAAKRKLFIDFLNNKKPKVLKDWNGNILLIMITSNPTTSFLDGTGMGMSQVSANWAQIGDAENQQDLIDTGFVQQT